MSILRRARSQASLADIAALAGVSVSTVSRIANGDLARASPPTIARVQQLIQQLDYRPNPVGRSLRGGESRLVAMLAPNLDNPAMAAIAASTENALRDTGYVMILCDTHDRPELQDEYLRAMRSRFVEGLVLVSAVASAELKAAVARDETIVFVNRPSPYGDGAFVGIDNRRAGAEAAQYLLDLGAQSLAVIRPDVLSVPIRARIDGFIERVKLRRPRSVIRRAAGTGDNHLQIGYAATRSLIADGGWPDGVLCPSDLMAYGLYRVATETGMRIPDQCRPIGIDDNTLNEWIAPWLSSIRIPYEAFGERIVACLHDLRSSKRVGDLLLEHRLISR